MTDIEELVALLAERGVDHWTDDDGAVGWGANVAYQLADGLHVVSRRSGLTAGQAIDATLGRGECDQLRAENAKLRELVRDMNECLEHSKPFCKKCKFQELNCQWFEFDKRMRELEVELS